MKTIIGWILVLCIGYFFIAKPIDNNTKSLESISAPNQELQIRINNNEIDTLHDQMINVEIKCSKTTDSIKTKLYKNIEYLKQVDNGKN